MPTTSDISSSWISLAREGGTAVIVIVVLTICTCLLVRAVLPLFHAVASTVTALRESTSSVKDAMASYERGAMTSREFGVIQQSNITELNKMNERFFENIRELDKIRQDMTVAIQLAPERHIDPSPRRHSS